MTASEEIKERAWKANMELKESNLIVLTWGNASEIDRSAGIVAIKPSGVAYESLRPEDIVLIDIETGKLLKKYSFTDEGAYDTMLETLEDYYEDMASGDTGNWNNYANCGAFKTDDFDEDAGTGWSCGEMRSNLQNPPEPPDELLQPEMCWECPNDIACSEIGSDISYAKICCSNKREETYYVDECKPCNNENDCNQPSYFCHNNTCTKKIHLICSQPCDHEGDPDCDICSNNICEDTDTCVENLICSQPCDHEGDPDCDICSNNICEDTDTCIENDVCGVPCDSDCSSCNNDICEDNPVSCIDAWGDCQIYPAPYTRMVASQCDNHSQNSLNASRSCSWRYIEFDDGSVDYWLKTQGCWLVPEEERGRLCFHVGGNFNVNGVAAHPVAYNTTFGEFITRSFMPTTGGVIWRLDMSNGLYDDTADEGMMIAVYTDNDVDYGWGATKFFDVSSVPDPEDDSINIPKRPIMAPPALGLTYNRSLVMFFGTGRTDDLEYYADRDYFFAVEEVLNDEGKPDVVLDENGKPLGFGKMFNRDGAAAATAMKLDDGERLYGKPLVAAGKVILTTYMAEPDDCDSGTSRMHIIDYDNVPADTATTIWTYPLNARGTPSAPSMVWTPTGPVILAQVGAGVEVLPVADHIKPTAHALHWGQVL